MFKVLFGISIIIVMLQNKVISVKFFTSNAIVLTILVGMLSYYELQRISVELHTSGVSLNKYYLFVLKCLSTGFLEEILFRGILFTGIYKNFYHSKIDKFHRSAFISSTIFALAHLGSFFANNQMNLGLLSQVFSAFFMGYLFCGLLVFSRNILFISFIHALINHYGGFNTFLNSSNQTAVVSMEEYATSMMTLIIVFSLIVFPVYYFLTEHKNDWQSLLKPDPYRLEQ